MDTLVRPVEEKGFSWLRSCWVHASGEALATSARKEIAQLIGKEMPVCKTRIQAVPAIMSLRV